MNNDNDGRAGDAQLLTSYLSDRARELLKTWISMPAFFRQRRAILANPEIMLSDSNLLDKSFLPPIQFGIKCLGIYLVFIYGINVPIAIFAHTISGVDAIAQLSLLRKIESLTIPVVIFSASYLFRKLLGTKIGNNNISNAHIIHMTYLMSLLFWPNFIGSILLECVSYWTNYIGKIDPLIDPEKMILESMGIVSMIILLLNRKKIVSIFDIPWPKIYTALFFSNAITAVVVIIIEVVLILTWPVFSKL